MADKMIACMECAHCNEVTVYEIQMPGAKEKTEFEFKCEHCGKNVKTDDGSLTAVDLEKIGEERLKRVKRVTIGPYGRVH